MVDQSSRPNIFQRLCQQLKKKEQTKCLSHSGSENCQRQLQHSATKLVLLCTAGNYVQNNQWRWVWTDDHSLPRHHTIFTSFSRNTKQNGLPDRLLCKYVFEIPDNAVCTMDVFIIFENSLVLWNRIKINWTALLNWINQNEAGVANQINQSWSRDTYWPVKNSLKSGG